MSRLVPAPDALVGKRFDVAVAKMLGISRAKAAELIEGGQARVLGRDISKSSTLQSGETVEFDIVEERTEPEPIAHDMAVVYEDDDVVVVDKPVGVAAHASVGWTGPTVLGSLLDRGVHITSYGAAGRQGIVSRLDVGTSGLMLVCKSDLAYVEMRRQFAEHEVVKTYHALVQGNLRENKATIEAPIGRAKVSDFRFCVTPAGKEAVTHWDVMERFGEATLVSVNLETGRTHQIRVHFSSIGHPLTGDAMYGANPQLSETLGLERQWLHAMQLEFRHPRTHVWTTVKSHYPADLQHALDVMRGRHDTQDNARSVSTRHQSPVDWTAWLLPEISYNCIIIRIIRCLTAHRKFRIWSSAPKNSICPPSASPTTETCMVHTKCGAPRSKRVSNRSSASKRM